MLKEQAEFLVGKYFGGMCRERSIRRGGWLLIRI